MHLFQNTSILVAVSLVAAFNASPYHAYRRDGLAIARFGAISRMDDSAVEHMLTARAMYEREALPRPYEQASGLFIRDAGRTLSRRAAVKVEGVSEKCVS
jgi:hypothetical protein